MTTARSNPARVLYDILVAAGEAGTSSMQVRKVWSELFQVPEYDPRLARKLSGLLDLANEVRTAVAQRHPRNYTSVNGRMAQVERASLLDLGADWATYWGTVDGQGLLDVLDVIAGLLDTSDHVGLVIKNVEELERHLKALLSDINAPESDIEEDVRRVVERHLHRILQYLDRSETSSTDELVPIIEGAAGAILNDHTLAEKLIKSKAGSAVLAALVALQLFAGARALSRPALPPPDPDISVILQSNCYSQPALSPAPKLQALERGSVLGHDSPSRTG